MANPTIASTAAARSAVDTFCQILINNTGSAGMVKTRVSEYTGSCVQKAEQTGCIEAYNPYINGLYGWMPVQVFQVLNSVCFETFSCSSGDNCATLSCSTWNASPYDAVNNIITDISIGNTPTAVGNLTLTPGNAQIAAAWQAPANTSIFCYNIRVNETITGIEVTAGSLTWNRNTVTVSNLTNGKSYNISVNARSYDGYLGPSTVKSATPLVTCTAPLCGFSLS
jgi:ethanolamine utilization microcompartment shell protein EutS